VQGTTKENVKNSKQASLQFMFKKEANRLRIGRRALKFNKAETHRFCNRETTTVTHRTYNYVQLPSQGESCPQKTSEPSLIENDKVMGFHLISRGLKVVVFCCEILKRNASN